MNGTQSDSVPELRYLVPIAGMYVATLLVANTAASRPIQLGPLVFPGGIILFPIAYIFGDILTEVYGYAKARQAIWTGFFCNLLAVIAIWIAGWLPAAPFWSAGAFKDPQSAQLAYQAILGFTPRLLLASFIAYLVGEFLNSLVLAKLKVRTGGRYLWLRTISSTLIGQAADSVVFISIAFGGILSLGNLQQAVLSQWLFKVLYEILATPLTYLVVNALKRLEKVDFYDRDTNFNPIKLK